VIVCAVALSGCTPWSQYWRNNMKVGPEYLRPPAPVENEWIDSQSEQVRSNADAEALWWEQFQDPILNGLVLQAYEQNLSLRDAGFRVLAARAAYNITVGGFFPQNQAAVADYGRYQFSQNVGAFNTVSSGAFSYWGTGLNLSWELDIWGKLRRNIEAAKGKYQASVEEYDAVLVNVIADVADRYTDYRVAEKQVADISRLAEIQRGSLQIARAQFEEGIKSELDVSQSKINLANTEALIIKFEKNSRVASNALCMLLGIAAEDLHDRLGDQDIPTTPPFITAGIPADLLRRRPEVRQAERVLAAQCAEIGVAESELYPALAINGYIGVSANEIGELFDSSSQIGFIAPAVNWKILNYGRLLNNIRQQDAKFQSCVAKYQDTVLRAGRESEDGIVTFIKARESARKNQESLNASERSAELVLIQYKEGVSDFNRVFVVQQVEVQERIKLNESVGAVSLGMIKVYRGLGSGWQLRLEKLATNGQCCKPLPSVDGVLCDDFIGKQPPAGFDAWCLWWEWMRSHKPR
jgi:NodT family efflux transporter outer membrane factor (OMF) lipoprotein